MKNIRNLNLCSTNLSMQTYEKLRQELPALENIDIRYTDAWWIGLAVCAYILNGRYITRIAANLNNWSLIKATLPSTPFCHIKARLVRHCGIYLFVQHHHIQAYTKPPHSLTTDWASTECTYGCQQVINNIDCIYFACQIGARSQNQHYTVVYIQQAGSLRWRWRRQPAITTSQLEQCSMNTTWNCPTQSNIIDCMI